MKRAGDALRIGCVKYLNARPLIYGWSGEVCFDHPAALCQKLAAGELDVALVSSFEFLRNPIYTIVDGVSISSAGPVASVFVAHSEEWSAVETIELDPASRTSVNLLRCLLPKSKHAPELLSQMPDAFSALTTRRGRLLIGDQAIRFREKFGERYHYWDLGEQWQFRTTFPFVYALWLIRPEVENAAQIATRLRQQRAENLTRLDMLIAAQNDFDPAFCEYYFHECLRFDFGVFEKEGLAEFQQLCQEREILPPPSMVPRFV